MCVGGWAIECLGGARVGVVIPLPGCQVRTLEPPLELQIVVWSHPSGAGCVFPESRSCQRLFVPLSMDRAPLLMMPLLLCGKQLTTLNHLPHATVQWCKDCPRMGVIGRHPRFPHRFRRIEIRLQQWQQKFQVPSTRNKVKSMCFWQLYSYPRYIYACVYIFTQSGYFLFASRRPSIVVMRISIKY